MIKLNMIFKDVSSDDISKHYMTAFLSLDSSQKRAFSRAVRVCEISDDNLVLELDSTPKTITVSELVVGRIVESCPEEWVQGFLAHDGDKEILNSDVIEDVVAEVLEEIEVEEVEEIEVEEVEEKEVEIEPLTKADLSGYIDDTAWDAKKSILKSDLSLDELEELLLLEQAGKERVTVTEAIKSKIIDEYDLSSILAMSVSKVKQHLESGVPPEFVLEELLDEEVNNKNRKSLVPFLQDLIEEILADTNK